MAKKLAYFVEYLWMLEIFSTYFHQMKALYVQMMGLYPIFQFIKGRCHDNEIMLP